MPRYEGPTAQLQVTYFTFLHQSLADMVSGSQLYPKDGEGFRGEVIWNNPNVSSPKHMLHIQQWKQWVQAGVTLVHHLCHLREGRLMGQDEIADTYGINCNFLHALAVQSSIPFSWGSKLLANFQGGINLRHDFVIRERKLDILSTSPKAWYADWVVTGKPPFF